MAWSQDHRNETEWQDVKARGGRQEEGRQPRAHGKAPTDDGSKSVARGNGGNTLGQEDTAY